MFNVLMYFSRKYPCKILPNNNAINTIPMSGVKKNNNTVDITINILLMNCATKELEYKFFPYSVLVKIELKDNKNIVTPIIRKIKMSFE